MSATIWGKFFWSDWENDPALKLCSLGAQGLWMRILCVCAKADPKGYLLVNGQPLSPADLASLVGKPAPEVEALMEELGSKGVFSRDRTGRIYSRRMVRDANNAKKARQNGKKGGNPSLSKQRQISPSVNPPDKPPDKPHIPEARSQNIGKTSSFCPKPRKRISYTEDFERFWKGYPTDANMSKKEAFAEWQRLDPDSQQKAIASVPGFDRYCRKNPDYRPIHACRYLKNERFEGHLETAKEVQHFESKITIRRGTPPFDAWNEYRKSKGQPAIPGDAWSVPTEWPPESSAA